jgi:hypothetical protein
MRITRQSAAELLLEDSGRGLLFIAAMCIGIAAISAFFAAREGKVAAALIVLTAFGAAGVVMLRRAREQTHHFDLRRETLTIASRPALALGAAAWEVETHPLSSLADVVVEESSSAPSGRTHSYTYRLVYVFADGARRPLLPYYTSGRSQYAALQETLRALLRRQRRD